MGQKITGGCACGAIRYASNADPIVMVELPLPRLPAHHGSADAAVMVVPAAAVTLTGSRAISATRRRSRQMGRPRLLPGLRQPGHDLSCERFPDALALSRGKPRRSHAVRAGHGYFHHQRAALGSHEPETQKRPKGMAS